MKKIILIGLVLLAFAHNATAPRLFAQDSRFNEFMQEYFTPAALFTGLNLEMNKNVCWNDNPGDIAFGIAGMFGVDFDSQFAAGLRTAGSFHPDHVKTLEVNTFFRYKIPQIEFPEWLQWMRWLNEHEWPFGISGGPFVQGDIGFTHFWWHEKNKPLFHIGSTLGWQFMFTDRFYFEPVVRFGMPFVWGAGVSVGVKFPIRKREEFVHEPHE